MSGPLKGLFVEVSPQTFIGRPNSEGGCGVVTVEHPDGSFDIKWTLGGSEKNVARSRITSLNPFVTTARQRNANDVARPSILAPSHQPDTSSRPDSCSPTSRVVSPPTSPTNGVSAILLQSHSWSKYDPADNPLLVHLHKGMKDWRRTNTTNTQTTKMGRRREI